MRWILWLLLAVLVAVSLAFASVRHRGKHVLPHAWLLHSGIPARSHHSATDEHLNSRVNRDQSGQIQNEEMLCISPLDSLNAVIIWRDFRYGYRRVGWAYTFDGGETWEDDVFPQMYHPWQSDPVLVVNHEGVFTVNMMTYDADLMGEDGLIQLNSYDGGVSWQDTVWAANEEQPVGLEDKQMLAVDTSPDSPFQGSFYCAWSHWYGENGSYTGQDIWLTYKRPGEPYSEPQILSEDGAIWALPATGPDGDVYLTYVDWYNNLLMFTRSYGGEAWEAPWSIQDLTYGDSYIVPDVWVFSYGAIAVDNTSGPHRGRIYLAFMDVRSDLSETDVWFCYSDNFGGTWTDRRRVDDEQFTFPVDQFHPWISVDEAGRVWIAFYDRRNDPSNVRMDLYFTASADGGQTWIPNQRITTVSSDPSDGTLDAGRIGEYIGFQARNGIAMAAWTDTRLGDQDVFAARIDSVFIIDAAHDRRTVLPSALTVSLYPNPTNSAATMSFTLPAPDHPRVHLYNTAGQLVIQHDLGARTAGAHHYSLDLSGLAAGVYIAALRADHTTARVKALLVK